MRRFLLLLLAIVLLASNVHITTAQPDQVPLMAMIVGNHGGLGWSLGGNLWSWTGRSLVQATSWTFNFSPIVSPDGHSLVYRSLPRTFVTANDLLNNPDNVAGWDSIFPSNIWLVPSTPVTWNDSNNVRIADQANVNIFRSDPAWSPDSKQLAWTETSDNPRGVYKLVIYNTIGRNAKSFVVDALHDSPGGQNLGSVTWNELGISVMSSNYIGGGKATYSVDFFGEDGKLSRQIDLNTLYGAWVQQGDKSMLIQTDWSNSQQWLVDPLTGNRTAFSGREESYSLLSPNGKSVYSDKQGHVVVQQNGKVVQTISLDTHTFGGFAISADGENVAYLHLLSEGPLQQVLYMAGTTEPLTPSPLAILDLNWGPIGVRVVSDNALRPQVIPK